MQNEGRLHGATHRPAIRIVWRWSIATDASAAEICSALYLQDGVHDYRVAV